MNRILPIVILLLVIGIFFSPTLFQGKLPIPSDTLVGLYHPWRDLFAEKYPRGIPFKNFLITDPVRQQIPWRKIAIEDIKNGRLPLWNPYSFAGSPLMGNIQAGVFYPLNILFFIFPFSIGWTLLIVSQPIMGGIFLYFYLQNRKLNMWASLISSIAWSFSGFMIAWLTWGTIGHTALWLPLILLCLDKIHDISTSRNKMIWMLSLGASLSFSFFAGHVQIFLYCAFYAALYSGYKIYQQKSKNIFIILLLSSLVFLVLTFFQWRSLFGALLPSSRVIEENLMAKEGWFLPWKHVIQFFIPDFFGNPATLNYWGTWNYGELVGYIGILPLLFSFVGILSSKFKDKIFWLCTLMFWLLLILPTPIARLPYIFHIPFISSLQPTRLMVLVIFSLIIFSAHGFHDLIESKITVKKPFALIGGILTLSVILSLYLSKFSSNTEIKNHFDIAFRNSIVPVSVFLFGSIELLFRKNKRVQSTIILCIVLLVSFDLVRFGKKFTPFTDAAYFFPVTKIMTYLQNEQKPFRVLAADDRILPANSSAYFGVEMPSGYDPIYSKFYEGLIAAQNRGTDDLSRPYGFNRIVNPNINKTPIFDLLDVKYVITFGPLEDNQFSFVMNEGNTFLYKNNNHIPRFFFVTSVTQADSFETSIKKLFSHISVKEEAVVIGNVSVPASALSINEQIQVILYTNSRITLESNTEMDRYMVILNSYYPGWKITIDSKEVTLFQTDGAFMGTVVPKGKHTIQLFYEP